MKIDEIAPDIFRFSTYLPQADLQFNQFLVRDEEPLLFHTGLRTLFPQVRKAVGKILDPTGLRWVSFSHFEADECGSLNEWLALAPRAQPLCGLVAAKVSINDIADRRALVPETGQVLATGRHRFRYLETPQVPHGWDAGLLFEETGRTLFCSDLLLQSGNVAPMGGEEILERARQSLADYEAGPLAHSYPFTRDTEGTLHMLAGLEPTLLAAMHGSSFAGNGRQALYELAGMLKEVLE